MHKTLNLAIIDDKGNTLLGPGKRFCIWTQGCQLACKNCISPSFQTLRPNILIDGDKLAAEIAAQTDIQGITISGGEPFLQASKLSYMLEELKKRRPEMDVIIFTGYKLEDLTWDKAKHLLQYTDLLIDGAYIEDLSIDQGLRGSSNQRFHFLTHRLEAHKESIIHGNRGHEIRIYDDAIFSIGIPKSNSPLLSNL